MQLITGRTIYHFHTRTKAGREPEFDAAAPEVWVELAAEDADRLGLAEGDLADLVGPRGRIRAPGRAANEMTITDWDPVSKQPLFKLSAVAVEAVRP